MLSPFVWFRQAGRGHLTRCFLSSGNTFVLFSPLPSPEEQCCKGFNPLLPTLALQERHWLGLGSASLCTHVPSRSPEVSGCTSPSLFCVGQLPSAWAYNKFWAHLGLPVANAYQITALIFMTYLAFPVASSSDAATVSCYSQPVIRPL